MTNKTPRIAKNIAKVPHHGYSQNGQIVFLSFFLLLLLSSDNLAQRCLAQSVTMVFARNSSIFNRAMQRPIAFSLPPSLHQAAAAAH